MTNLNATNLKLSFLDYHNIMYDYFHRTENCNEATKEFLKQIEIGVDSKNKAISALCQTAQLMFVESIEQGTFLNQ
jgi:hypothetical protein